MRYVRSGLIVLLALVAVDATASDWVKRTWGEDFSTRRVSSERYQAAIFLPESWSIDPDQQTILPSDATLAGCQIRFAVYQDAEFQRALAAGLQHDEVAADRNYRSALGRVGEAEAVWVWYVDKTGRRIGKTYIDQPGRDGAGFLLWTFDGPNTGATNLCERTFSAIVGSSSVKPVESIAVTPDN